MFDVTCSNASPPRIDLMVSRLSRACPSSPSSAYAPLGQAQKPSITDTCLEFTMVQLTKASGADRRHNQATLPLFPIGHLTLLRFWPMDCPP